MAVYPDRIVVKNSSDPVADVITNISPGQPDEILTGELVLATDAGNVRLLTRDSNNNIVSFGGTSVTTLIGLDDVNMTGLADDYILRYDAAAAEWKSEVLNFASLSDVSTTTLSVNLQDPTPRLATALASTNFFGISFGTGHGGISGDYDTTTLYRSNQSYFELSDANDRARLVSADGVFTVGSPHSSADAQVALENRQGNYVTLASPSATTGYTLTLPPDTGTAGFVLTVDANGDTYWSGGPAPDLSNSTLGGIGDVTFTSIQTGDGIEWDGSEWVNTLLVKEFGDLSNASTANTWSDHTLSGESLTIESIAYPDSKVGNWAHAGFAETRYETSTALDGGGSTAIEMIAGFNQSHQGMVSNLSSPVYSFLSSVAPSGIRLGQQTNSLRGFDDASFLTYANYVELLAPTGATNYSLTLPTASGASGQVLGVDGSGNLGWYDSYPPVGNGLAEIEVTESGGQLLFTGDGFDAATPQVASLQLFPGQEYRLDNQTGSSLSVRTADGNIYSDGVANGGTSSGVIAWNVRHDSPSTLSLSTATASAEVMVYSKTTPLQHTSIDSLSDVDTSTRSANAGDGLAWDGQNWSVEPLVSAVGTAYINNGTWGPSELATSSGGFSIGTSGSNTQIILNKTSNTGTDYEILLLTFVQNSTPLWISVELSFGGQQFTSKYAKVTSVTNLGDGSFKFEWPTAEADLPNWQSISINSVSATITLSEQVAFDPPVDSVNGQEGAVVIGVEELDNFFSDANVAALEAGFVYVSGIAGNNGEYQIISQNVGGSTVYDIRFANIDANGVNRRPMMINGATVYGKLQGSGTYITGGGTIDTTASDSITFTGISTALAEAIVFNTAEFKFQATPDYGYILEDKSLLQFDIKDRLWKPLTGVGGVTSVNGQTGDVGLNLNALTDVNAASATDNQVIQYDEDSQEWVARNLVAAKWDLAANGTTDYIFSGPGLTSELSPDLYLVRGQVYHFANAMGAHPFEIQDTGGTKYDAGITNNTVSDGVLIWEVQMDSPSTLKYQCTSHASMTGNIYILDQSSVGSIDDLSDVDTATTAPTPGQALIWDDVNGQWIPGDVSGGEASPAIIWDITAGDGTDYTFEGSGFPSPALDPTLYVMRGQKYTFNKTFSGHDFELQTTGGTTYTDGVTGSQPITGVGSIDWVVPMDAPSELKYQCTSHASMYGAIYVLDQSSVGSIDDLSDVDTTTTPPVDGEALVWDNASSLWVPGAVASTYTVVTGGTYGFGLPSGTPESLLRGMLFRARAYSSNLGTRDDDYANTSGSVWDEYYSEFEPFIDYPSDAYILVQGVGVNGNLVNTPTVQTFSHDWRLEMTISEGCWSGDDAVSTFQFKDANGTTVFWFVSENYGTFGTRVRYGGNDGNGLVYAPICGQYPTVRGYLDFDKDAGTVTYTDTRNCAGNGSVQGFTYTYPDIADIASVSLTYVNVEANWSGGDCSATVQMRSIDKV